MRHMPKLSIVIPAYNVAPYVRAAVDSALEQNYGAVEIVVVDDGSTDETSDILDSYGDRIVLVRQANRGLAGARNAGIAHATGELLGWLDADDLWLPSRSQQCVDLLNARPELAAVTTDAFILEGDTPTERHYYGDLYRYAFPTPDEQLAVIVERNFMFVGAVVRADVVRRHGGFTESLRRSEDYDLWMRLLLAGERFGWVPEPLAQYRVRPDSLSANAEAQWDAHLTVVERNGSGLRSAGVRPPAGVSYDIARRCARRHASSEAAIWYREAMRATPTSSVIKRAKLAGQSLKSTISRGISAATSDAVSSE